MLADVSGIFGYCPHNMTDGTGFSALELSGIQMGLLAHLVEIFQQPRRQVFLAGRYLLYWWEYERG